MERASTVESLTRLPLRSSPRFPLGLQLMVGVGALVALTAVAIVIAIFLVRGLGQGTEELTAQQVEYARAVDAAALRAKAMANDERGFLLGGGQKFLDRFERRAVRVRGSFATAVGAAEDREQRAAVREASAGFERWLKAARAEVTVFKSGDREAAIESALGPTRALRYEYESSLRGAQRLGASAIESGTASVSTASSQSVAILLVYLLSALLVAAAIAMWLIRTILRPVYALIGIFAEPGAREHLIAHYSESARPR